MATVSTVRTKDGIEWYCERQGSGADLVLCPSGEGDCASFAKVAAILAHSFRVTTFDMPGMSRSIAPEAAMTDLTPHILANQIVNLLDELSIENATFYGCSSGGLVVLALASAHSDRVRSAIVHEVPFGKVGPDLSQLKSMDDTAARDACRHIFATQMIESEEPWTALGTDFHARLDKNYVTWVRKYVKQVERSFSKDELTARPATWTVGALMPMGAFFDNVVAACGAGINISLLPCRHFPQVTIPDILAEHIRSATTQYL